MDTLEFIAAMTAALAWPLVVLVAVAMLRPQLRGLRLGRAKRAKVTATGVDLEFFDEQVGVASSALGPLPPANQGEGTSPVAEAVVDDLIKTSPGSAIVGEFARMETEVRELARMWGMKDAASATFSNVNDWLHRQAVLGTNTYEAITSLMQAREEALQDLSGVDRARARRYVKLAREVQSRTKIAAAQAPNTPSR
ncbi:hypothetical protein J2X85_003880 [Microbacterium trichothecenolyticum]|uniref:hypothetical protein n=1 Tax=Microbacterium trichothecenolyticum TaxID=69370 RepID=UPI00285C168E|nr:hypothetical protein [Microbacterium trichothecenolyticum]MDR7186819.1 hypothetical protein [Microbacterium trichothecenolyticum]